MEELSVSGPELEGWGVRGVGSEPALPHFVPASVRVGRAAKVSTSVM